MKLFCQWNQFTFINTFWLWLVHQIVNDFLSNKSIFTVTLTARKPFRLFQVLHPSGSDAAPIIGQRHDTWHEHFLWHENPPVDEGAIVVQQDSCDWEPLELMVGWKTNPWNWTHGINESRPNLFLLSGCIHIDSLRWPASRPTTHHWSRSEAPGSKKNSFIALHFGHGIPLGRPETIAMAIKITIYFWYFEPIGYCIAAIQYFLARNAPTGSNGVLLHALLANISKWSAALSISYGCSPVFPAELRVWWRHKVVKRFQKSKGCPRSKTGTIYRK